MFTFIEQGGPVMGIILLAGAIALIIFFERFLHVHRANIKTDDFLKGICTILRRGNVTEAVSICDETPGPVAYIVRAAILHHKQPREVMSQAVDKAALTEIARLERRFSALATIAQIAPLLGILGTVLGMIQAYLVIQQKSPLITIGDLAGGLGSALLTTAAGLAVAILTYVGYNFLVAKVDALALDMERAAGEILTFLTTENIPQTPATTR